MTTLEKLHPSTNPTTEELATSLVSAVSRFTTIRYETVKVGSVRVAFREAGDPARPTIVLFHGFPTSSHMFRNLIPRLAERFHVLAPDYPGFGASDMPSVDEFQYSFAHLAETMDAFLDQKGVHTYSAYAMDYGAPIAYRLFAKHPQRLSGFVVQNGNAYAEGLQQFWEPFRAYWAKPSPDRADALAEFLELPATEWQYTHGVPETARARVSPDNWHHDQFLLDRPGAKEVQMALFASYESNLAEYSKWQALFREHQPPALIVWGAHDHIFPASGAHPYRRDLKNVEMHLLDTGHFALETHLEFIAARMLDFLERTTST